MPTRYCLVLADKGYDADKRVIEPLQAQGNNCHDSAQVQPQESS
ncbi:hypothetical protein [Nostoc sp. ChiSLP03a]